MSYHLCGSSGGLVLGIVTAILGPLGCCHYRGGRERGTASSGVQLLPLRESDAAAHAAVAAIVREEREHRRDRRGRHVTINLGQTHYSSCVREHRSSDSLE